MLMHPMRRRSRRNKRAPNVSGKVDYSTVLYDSTNTFLQASLTSRAPLRATDCLVRTHTHTLSLSFSLSPSLSHVTKHTRAHLARAAQGGSTVHRAHARATWERTESSPSARHAVCAKVSDTKVLPAGGGWQKSAVMVRLWACLVRALVLGGVQRAHSALHALVRPVSRRAAGEREYALLLAGI